MPTTIKGPPNLLISSHWLAEAQQRKIEAVVDLFLAERGQ